MLRTALQAIRRSKLRPAMRTGCVILKDVETLTAPSAFPKLADRGRGLASRTNISVTPRQVGDGRHSLRLPKTAPADGQDVEGNNSQPGILPNEDDETGRADQSDYGRRHQAPVAAHHKPQQRSQNLSAIQRINRQNIENQQAEINVRD